MRFVVVPGIDNSDAQHWQSFWESEWSSAATRIVVDSWNQPDLDNWLDGIDTAVRQSQSPDVVIVAHSLGCLAAAQWSSTAGGPGGVGVAGVFLVAPPSSAAVRTTEADRRFADLDFRPLATRGLVVASTDDPFASITSAGRFAEQLAVPMVEVGPMGHINSASGVGRWDVGRNLLTAFMAGLG